MNSIYGSIEGVVEHLLYQIPKESREALAKTQSFSAEELARAATLYEPKSEQSKIVKLFGTTAAPVYSITDV